MPQPVPAEQTANPEIVRRRTFAIISHPDAGKTTLTEKLLLFGGAIQMAGAVKARGERRRTRSDWMQIEQQRGISVTSSVMTFERGGIVYNLLDTPGHSDFSEDTYRTLSAVDAAVMVMDAAKGIETQTRKLFEVCRLRDIPIITFINKIDREGEDPLTLLDLIASDLALDLVPMGWPVGMGTDFRGVLDLAGKKILLPESDERGAPYGHAVALNDLSDIRHIAGIDERIATRTLEGVELAQGALPAFDLEAFREGHLSPVFFGSALKNFGVEQLLDALGRLGAGTLAAQGDAAHRSARRRAGDGLRVQGAGEHGPEPPRSRGVRPALLGPVQARDEAPARARRQVDDGVVADVLLRPGPRDGGRSLRGGHHRRARITARCGSATRSPRRKT